MKTELERLKEQVAAIEAVQKKCNHVGNEPQHDTMKEEIFEPGTRATDLMPIPTGRFIDVPCYSRICSKCGKKEYTRETEEVVVKTVTRPKF